MRVLIFSNHFWPENFRINEIAAELVNRGHTVEVVAQTPNYPNGKYYKDYGILRNRRYSFKGANVRRMFTVPRGKGGTFRLALNYFSFLISATLLSPFCCRSRYDVIFIFMTSPITVAIPALLMRRIRKTPTVMWVLDLWPESIKATEVSKSPTVLNAVARLVHFIYKRCDKILLASKAFNDSVIAHGATTDKIEFFPNWVEDVYDIHETPEVPNAMQHLPQGFRIIFAGNIGRAQDFPTIINTADRLKKIPQIQFLILGNGSMYEWVAQEIKSRGLEGSFHLLGQHPAEQMPSFFAHADACLVTLADKYIFSLTVPGKIQSYLASGKPIVAAINGEGARVLHESGAGIAGPSGDSQTLAENILWLYNLSDAKRFAMGENGRHYSRREYDKIKLMDKLERILTKSAQLKYTSLFKESNHAKLQR